MPGRGYAVLPAGKRQRGGTPADSSEKSVEPQSGSGIIAETQTQNRQSILTPNRKIVNLLSAAQDAHAAIDEVVAAVEADRDPAMPINRYREAARGFAAKVLAERVRRSFEDKLDSVTQRPVETLAEKMAHAALIRDWLSPWNLGFRRPGTDEVYQLHAMSTGSHGPKGGTYTANRYGGGTREKISAWPEIKGLIDHGELCDVTEFVARRPARSR